MGGGWRMGNYIVPLDMGEAGYDKSLFFLRKYIGQYEIGKTVAAYIGERRRR
jgi:hypothetical protein